MGYPSSARAGTCAKDPTEGVELSRGAPRDGFEAGAQRRDRTHELQKNCSQEYLTGLNAFAQKSLHANPQRTFTSTLQLLTQMRLVICCILGSLCPPPSFRPQPKPKCCQHL